MSIHSTQKPSSIHSPQSINPVRVNYSSAMTGAPKPLQFVVSPNRIGNSVLKSDVQRTLDFKGGNNSSPMQSLQDLNRNHPVYQTNRPCIQPISSQPIKVKSQSLRLTESQVSSNMSLESITQQIDRRSYRAQKENVRHVENQSTKLTTHDVKDNLMSTIKDLEMQVQQNPTLLRVVQSLQAAVFQYTHQQQEQVQLWKNRCMDHETRQQAQSGRDQEYTKLRPIMDSLQQKLTVLVEENSKLNQYNITLKRQQEQTTNKDDIVQRFTLEREMLERDRDQLSKQVKMLEESSFKRQNTSSSSSLTDKVVNREVYFKLEQSEVKCLTLQIANDNLNQEMQHKILDMKTIENLKDKIQILETKVQELIQEKEILTLEDDRNKQDLEDKQTEYRKLQQQLYDCKVTMKQKMDQREQENQQMQIAQNQRTNEYNREKMNWEQEMRLIQMSQMKDVQLREDLEYERTKLKESIQQHSQENIKLNTHVGSLKEQIINLSQVLETLKENEHNLRVDIDQVQKYCRALKQEKDEQESKKNQDISNLQGQLQRASQNHQQLTSEYRQKCQQINQEVQDMKERQNARQQVDDTNQKQLNLVESKVLSQGERLQECEAIITHQEQEKRSLNLKFISSQNDFNRQRDEMVVQLQSDREELKWKIDHSNQDLMRKQQELVERTEEARTFKHKYNETLSNLDKVERKLLEKMENEIRYIEPEEKFSFNPRNY